MPIIGTAGHVDHGKSTLVAALTGRDPDRWAAEKARGLTIDLGFAWMEAGGHDLSFVDVPGHERFLKNMLAGIEAIDVALLVVAADEGWAAQSEEHLAVLDLLEVRSGVIALTKADRVDDDLLDLARLEIAERLGGTSLTEAPIVAVSAVEGTGLTELVDLLVDQVEALLDRTRSAPTLWVDRAFSVSGSGTVITGSLLGGPVSIGDSLELQPGALSSRVRSLQSHERSLESVEPGRRVAMGLPDIGRADAIRGTVLSPPGARTSTSTLLTSVRIARGLPDDALGRGAFHLHLGSGATPVRLRPVGDGAALLMTDTPVSAVCGDRFILRDVGRRHVVAGGRVLDPAPDPRTKAARIAAPHLAGLVDQGPDAFADALLRLRGVASPAALASWTGGGRASGGVVVGSLIMHPATITILQQRAHSAVADYHVAHPLRPGLPKAQLATTLGVGLDAVELIIESGDSLIAEGSVIRAERFSPDLDAASSEAWEHARSTLEASALGPPRASELFPDEEVLHFLVRSGELEAVGAFAYLPVTLQTLPASLAALPQPFTVSEAKEHLGISRKHAIPLMEWCDRAGITRRKGSERWVREGGMSQVMSSES